VLSLLRLAHVTALVTILLASCSDDAAPAASEKAPPRPTAGCSKAGAPKGYLAGQKITVRSTERSYELFVPESDGKTPLPTVFVFHGTGGSGADIRNAYGL
jgi:poly(3-hydroxybutyrate) depolymerase